MFFGSFLSLYIWLYVCTLLFNFVSCGLIIVMFLYSYWYVCSVLYIVFIVPTGTLRLPALRFYRAFSSVVSQMPGYKREERLPTRCNNSDDCQLQMFIINCCLNMFRASLCPSSGEQRPRITAYGVCAGGAGCGWLQLWCCVVGCERALWRLLAFQPKLLTELFYVLFVCKYILYYCHRVSTQLQFTNISYHMKSHVGCSGSAS